MKNEYHNEKEKLRYIVVTHLDIRILRPKDAAKYLGTNINFFNRTVRPTIPSIRLGNRAIGFDVLDLDRWLDQNKSRDGISRINEI